MLRKMIGLAAIGLLAMARPAAAIDVMPGDYTVLPPGTNAFLLYGQYATSSKLKVDGVGSIPGSSLSSVAGIARVLHYNQIAGIPIGLQAFIPFGAITQSRVGGFPVQRADGFGDLTVGFTVWPLSSNDPRGTTIGITSYLTLPTGNFRGTPGTTGVASLGSGAVTFTPQIGLIQGLGNGFFLDLTADVAIRGDSSEMGFRYTRQASVQVQGYLRYQFSAATNVAIGYSGTFGGKDFVNGIYAGTKTRTDQLRVTASTFLSPTIQVQGMVGFDVNTEGGFQQGFVGTLRLMTLF